MKIGELSASNFLSFRTLNFTVPDSGLHFIGGEVKGQAMSNSNGAGKSSIPEALCFGLYGKTIRNAGKDDIINRAVGKDCVVAVMFESDGHEYTVFRFRGDSDNANELRLLKGEQDITAGTMNETQDMIDHVLGMNWLVFSNAVIFGENARRFTQAKDSEKKQVFDEIMMFHQYVEAQTRAKDEVKALKATLGENESQLKIVLTSIDQYKASVEEEEERLAEARRQKQESLKQVSALQAEVSAILVNIEKSKAELVELERDYSSLNEDNDTLYQSMTALAGEKSDAVREYRTKEDEHNLNLRQHTKDRSELQNIVNGEGVPEGTRCPHCKQPVTAESKKEMKEHFSAELDKLLKLHEVESEAYLKAKSERERLEREFDQKIGEVTNLRKEYDTQLLKMVGKIDALKQYILSLEGDKTKKENEIQVVEGYTDKAIEEIEERKKQTLLKMEPLQQKLLDLTTSVERTKGEIEYYEFWVEGFGNTGVKSFLLDEVVPELNRKANYYASMLMDEDIQIEFKTESMLKSGETRDKFNVSITMGEETVAYENCSSGEKGRIDVAILLALQNLIFSRSANNCNLVVFDEVFEHLDITGVERVVNLLREEAQDKAILVISHQNELRDYFDNQILVVKDENGSRVEQ
jgi:DNA repair exonuclease SbcCD ATPase subunit